MFTGLSTVATRRTPPRLGVPWPKATRGMGTPSAPRPAPAVMLAAPAIHWRRDSLPLLSLSSRACFIARPPRPNYSNGCLAWYGVTNHPLACRARSFPPLGRPDTPRPPAGAGEEGITRRHAEPHERLQLEGHESVHAVGATGEADARGEMAGEILVHHPT